MPRCTSVWVPLAVLSPLLLAVGALECSEKQTLLKTIPGGVMRPTDCLMECSGMTYVKKLQLRDNNNIRMRDSTEGDPGEHCWSTEIKCTVGEGFHRAYVVLPVRASAAGHRQVDVRTADPSSAALHPHGEPTVIDDGCGPRYDVTQHFGARATGTTFCIRLAAQEDAAGDSLLRCPPYLVTLWTRKQFNRQDGGSDVTSNGVTPTSS